ncbi:Ppx/GppA phosphatase family protein [Tenacibaculum skagerrakense]|uniref:Ppx/GppA phosphatase family protein n=1 Tax=Tenacibaculum skagerrakense TaxID=186571 RepID=A0A4R2NTD7_9FLAO|nr:hypothetical protein [Tenacibaculum skagerrakense]TCP25117.1 Ppx/GppA phosphatase family protein [Tenacibaculum skagerrakense]
MLRNYNGKKGIAVLELSSTAIKRLTGVPKECLGNTNDLRRFNDNVMYVDVAKYIDDSNSLNVVEYKKGVMPYIMESIKYIQNKAPQIYQIVLTGLYRTIINWNDLENLLTTEIAKLKRVQPISIQLMSPEEESQLSFMSWFETTSETESDPSTHDNFFMFNKGLNIDVGGGTTEISIVSFGSFRDTISLPFGAEQFYLQIKNTHYIDKRHFYKDIDDKAIKLQNSITTILKTKFPTFDKLFYCICSGSNIIILGGDNEENYRRSLDSNRINLFIKDSRSIMIDIIYPYLIQKKVIPEKHQRLFNEYCSLVILKSIVEYFSLASYIINKANLRIGVFYDLLNSIKPTNLNDQF